MNIFVDYLIPMNDKEPAKDCVISLENKFIKDIETNQKQAKSSDTVYLALPGFINNHIHLSYESTAHPVEDKKQLDWMKTLVAESRPMKSERKSEIAAENIKNSLKAGVTHIADNTPFIETAKEIINSPLKGLIGYEVFGINFDSDKEFQEDWENNYLSGYKEIENIIKQQGKDRDLEATLSPHSIYTVGPRRLQQTMQWAKENNKLLLLHLAEFWFEAELTKLGHSPDALQTYHEAHGNHHQPSLNLHPYTNISPVEYLHNLNMLNDQVLLTHMIETNEKDIELLSNANAKVISCPRSNCFLRNRKSPIANYKEADILTSFATDGVSSNYDLDILEEIRSAALLHPEISAKSLLESITSIPAKQINKAAEIGSIEKGKDADIIVFEIKQEQKAAIEKAWNNGNIYEYILRDIKSSQISQLYINGQIVSQN